MQRVPQAEKGSQQVSERHLRRRTSALEKVGDALFKQRGDGQAHHPVVAEGIPRRT